MNWTLFALPLFAFAVAALGQEEAKPDDATAKSSLGSPAPADKPATPHKRYELKNKSSFNVAENVRSPFLPIGWVKRGEATAPVVDQTTVDASGFRLTSILIGNPSMAVINGRSYEEGQFLRMPRGGPQVLIRLYRIGDGQVWLQSGGQVFPVPLKRPELSERKIEEQLLNEERDIVPVPQATPQPTPATAANQP